MPNPTHSITPADIMQFKSGGDWRILEQQALLIFNDLHQRFPDTKKLGLHSGSFSLGGGTRLMLDLHHRMSDDIDIFLTDPQLLNYFSPATNDAAEEVCQGDYVRASEYIKLKRKEGQIDFICGNMLLPSSSISCHHDTPFPVEPMAEVLAKKLFYRGANLKHRDLFDWWAILNYAPKQIDSSINKELATLLQQDKLDTLLASVDHLEQQFIKEPQERWLQIRTHQLPNIEEAAAIARKHLHDIGQHLLPESNAKIKF